MAQDVSLSTFSTSLVDPKLRSRCYRKVLRAYSDVSFTEEASINASIVTYSVKDLTIALTQSGSAYHIRNREVRERSAISNSVLVQLLLDGDIYAKFGDKSAALSRGDIFFIDLSMDCEIWIDRCECIHLLIPKSYLYKVVRLVHGRTIRPDSLIGSVFSGHFVRCMELLRHGDPADAARTAHLAVDMMIQYLTESPARENEDEALSVIRQPILKYIDTHLAQPQLDASSLSAEFGISRAKLYRIFSEFGGVQLFIRNRRLDAVLRDLCEHPKLSIAQAAQRYGFSNDRQFQRAFRAKFGVTARDARMAWNFDRFTRQRRT